ncbi:EamA family transporter [Brevibacillus fluminis]|uniref:EamA family transporter n=1 Tax=Brevibacillus fluminis TaxID=511487 RepID=UPI001605E632
MKKTAKWKDRVHTSIEVTTYAIVAGTVLMLLFSQHLFAGIFNALFGKTMVLVYLGVFPGALAYLSWSFALSTVQASIVSSFLFLVPLLTLEGY